MDYDVAIIGGGPSGLMAAIGAAEQGARTILIEKGKRLGTKLMISGGGRCNVTSRLRKDEIIEHIPGNGRFLYSAFSVFDNEDIIDFFEDLGVRLKEEDHGRMFPVSDSARDVVQALLTKLDQLNVKIITNSKVSAIDYGDTSHSVILADQTKISVKSIVVAVGGKAVPHTGSTGDGYPWAKKAGHTITELYPTEVALLSNDPFIKSKSLQGLSLRDAKLTVKDKMNKPVISHQMDMIFTHFGLSGPAVLRCSQFVVKLLNKDHQQVSIFIDTVPDKNIELLYDNYRKLIDDSARKSVKNLFKGIVPERYLLFIFEQNKIDPELKCANLSNEQLRNIITDLKEFKVNIHGSLPLEKAFVTGGGISIKEINPTTMASKMVDRLFFSGEILDIHGYTGGYNITAALITGRLAGQNAAWSSF